MQRLAYLLNKLGDYKSSRLCSVARESYREIKHLVAHCNKFVENKKHNGLYDEEMTAFKAQLAKQTKVSYSETITAAGNGTLNHSLFQCVSRAMEQSSVLVSHIFRFKRVVITWTKLV